MQWAVAAIVPGLVCLLLVPLVLLRIAPPEIRQIPNARQIARDELEKMGPMSRDELVLSFVFLMCLVLWATGSLTGLGATSIAMLAVSIMLIAGVLTWKDILAEKGAWDAMFWMGGLMGSPRSSPNPASSSGPLPSLRTASRTRTWAGSPPS